MSFFQQNTRVWIRGLVAAIVSAGSSAVTVMVVDPNDFNPFADAGAGWSKLGTVVLVNAIFGAALYLKSHPLPDEPAQLDALAKAVAAKQDAVLP